jgi:drug/metabolite transporter (DMT)-like permease
MSKKSFWVYCGLMVSMFFFSLSFVWYKEVYKYFLPITTVFLRLLISSVLLFVISKSFKKLEVPKGKDIYLFILAAIFEPFIYFLGEAFGMKWVSPSLAAIIISTIPLFSPLAAYFFLKEKISFMNFMGIVISIVGVALVIINKQAGAGSSVWGIALMFLAVLAAVGYSTVVKKISEKYNSYTIVTFQNSLGTLFFAPLFFFFDYPYFHLQGLSIAAIMSILKLSIFSSTIAWIFYTTGIRNIGVTRATMFSNLIPVFTAIFAYFILNETLDTRKMIGIVIVIAGLYISQIKRDQALLN